MDTQMVANALLLVPAAVLGVLAVRARRRGRTRLGLSVRPGPLPDLARGVLFGAVSVGVLYGALAATGTLRPGPVSGVTAVLVGVAVYFLVLFLVEEVVFRALLMTGLGVVVGRTAALVVTSVLVAVPYVFSTGSGVLPVVGAVATNLVNGLARWRTGRIWFGVGMRWAWNTLQVALGFTVSGYALATPVLDQSTTGPSWLTGGEYGPEGGVVGIALRVVMIVVMVGVVRGSVPAWTIGPRGSRDGNGAA
ncbi:CPBP family intramembrane glutamic endopeptidase [Pseudonocardia sp. ICBG601]|uniref:CPBP family intramembrane glutamic endopeptidase n=1 Tax=Pseudonocardia sp. ICBG601 TaxID=2846759 RepID=UPI001CF6B281|nr:CPBP family intramembrane glutamic endopeptidase [Pseudonocardia sp. ICBG601]